MDEIKILQYSATRRLASLGYVPVSSVQKEDASSLKPGIQMFQERHRLKPTGELDQATVQKLAEFRCAMPDFRDPLAAIATGPWTKRNLSYRFDAFTAQVPVDYAKAAIVNAFNTWMATDCGLTFFETDSCDAADICVSWRKSPDSDHNMNEGQVAHADLPPGYSMIVSSPPLPLHLNESDPWTIGKSPLGYDIETIALHEIGHCLGLLHGLDPDTVMYANVYRDNLKRILTSNDVASLRLLYP